MNTPICDFVKDFAAEAPLRLHMPGHKGSSFLGCEALDITEVDGAESLYDAGVGTDGRPSGIIAESEANASGLFGCPTFYSAEGSSLAIRAMLYIAATLRADLEEPTAGSNPLTLDRPRILAGRNAHKTLLNTAALLDLDINWLYPQEGESYHACTISPSALESEILRVRPIAVYVTSPDYLGNVADIRGLAEVCHRHGVLLLVDNAHGAYLKFMEDSLHPMDLGADMCCDSAHKTLPVLTGGGYLHVRPEFASLVKPAMALFGSTSPSFLILQSLDAANAYVEEHGGEFTRMAFDIAMAKQRLLTHGYTLIGNEPFKLTIQTKPYGYTGDELAAILMKQDIISEFHDPDFVVFMLSTENMAEDIKRLTEALLDIPQRAEIPTSILHFSKPQVAISPRQAVMSPSEQLPVEQCIGRILAQSTVGCPPAVPIVMSGEIIDEAAVQVFQYYGIRQCRVVK